MSFILLENTQAIKTAQQAAVGSGTDVTWETVTGPFSEAAGVFTLPPGHLYELRAYLNAGMSAASISTFQWVDSSNVALADTSTGRLVPTDFATAENSTAYSTCLITTSPTTSLDVKLRIITVASGTLDIEDGSVASLRQIA